VAALSAELARRTDSELGAGCGRTAPEVGESTMAGFLFKLETVEGKPADAPQFSAAVPN
jgi:hypothetical protein